MKDSNTAHAVRTSKRSASCCVRATAVRHALRSLVFIGATLAASIATANDAQRLTAPRAAMSVQAAGAAGTLLPQGGIQFFTDPAAFTAALGVPSDLTTETFDGGAPIGPFPTNCGDPMNSASNDACFAPGQLANGFSISTQAGAVDDIIIFPTGFLGPGQSSRAVGAANFADTTIVSFAPTINAAAANVFGGTTVSAVDVEVFDSSGSSLGTTIVAAGATRDAPVFFGVVSPTPIGKITFNTEAESDGELINNLQFRAAGLLPPGVIKAFSPSAVSAGSTSTLTITLGNQAQPDTATLSAPLTDSLPSGLLVAMPPNAATSCASGALTANAGDSLVMLSSGAQIPGAGTCTITVDVSAANAGLYVNTIPAGALQTDLGNSSADATATLTVSSGQQGGFPPAENFDEVFAPALPDGWTSSATTGSSDWVTTTAASDSAPNAAFAPDMPSLADFTLDSPVFTPVAGQNVAFRQQFNLERGDDGAVLEISINGGEFADILSAGGRFVTGGYASLTIFESTGTSLAGRPAWTGNSNGFVTTIASLPAAAVGQPTRLRFHTADDGSFAADGNPGWWIDSILLGVDMQPPAASVAPASLNFSVDPDATATDTIDLANAAGSDALTFSVESRSESTRPAKLVSYSSSTRNAHTLDSKPRGERPFATLARHGFDGPRHTAASPWVPLGSLIFQLDDGSAEDAEGVGMGSFDPPVPFTEYAAVWLNRFNASDALVIHSMSVYWPEIGMAGGDLLGLQANLVVYYDADADGDPSNAVRVGTDDLVSIATTGNFQTYQTNFSIPASGDVYIGFVDQWALAGGFTPRLYPAAVDETQPQSMSYISSVNTPPVDIVNLGNNDINEPFTDANLMIRASATGGGNGGPCSGPIVSWLTATPASGSVNGGSSMPVTVTVDPSAASLMPGNYTAELCITTNDPTQGLISVPVSMTVNGTPPPTACNGGSDEIFCDGFDGAAGNPNSQSVVEPGAQATTAPGGSSADWQSLDNLAAKGEAAPFSGTGLRTHSGA